MCPESKLKPNGYQVRTERTKAKILQAAEVIFARDGYDGAQLEEIAKAADRSKGAIYAHYASKDDLFLALMEDRGRQSANAVFEAIKDSETEEEAMRDLRQSVSDLLQNRTFLLLSIEAKLHAIRHSEFRERWLAQNEALNSKQQQEIRSNRGAQLILASQTPEQRSTWGFRMYALGPILHGLALEAAFEPERYAPDRFAQLCKELIGFLIGSI